PVVVLHPLRPLSLFGEHFEVNDGLGHDGVFYVTATREFDTLVLGTGVSPYRIQRVAVPGTIHYLARLAGVRLPDPLVLSIWRWLDIGCVTLVVALWLSIAADL